MHKEKFVNAIVEELIQNDCDIEATGDFLIACLLLFYKIKISRP